MRIVAWKNLFLKKNGRFSGVAEIAFLKKRHCWRNPRLVAEKRLSEENRERSTLFIEECLKNQYRCEKGAKIICEKKRFKDHWRHWRKISRKGLRSHRHSDVYLHALWKYVRRSSESLTDEDEDSICLNRSLITQEHSACLMLPLPKINRRRT